MTDDLWMRLQASSGDMLRHIETQADWIKTQAERIAALELENAGLAANQCLHDIHCDDAGSPHCPRIAELEKALGRIVDICLLTCWRPGIEAQKMQSIAMATLIKCDCAGQCKHYGECISKARAVGEVEK